MDGVTISDTLRTFADDNGFISRESMREALRATLGESIHDNEVDLVMRKLGANDECGNSIVSVMEAEAALASFHRAASSVTEPVSPTQMEADMTMLEEEFTHFPEDEVEDDFMAKEYQEPCCCRILIAHVDLAGCDGTVPCSRGQGSRIRGSPGGVRRSTDGSTGRGRRAADQSGVSIASLMHGWFFLTSCYRNLEVQHEARNRSGQLAIDEMRENLEYMAVSEPPCSHGY